MMVCVCRSVLVVDDDPAFRGLARRLLGVFGLAFAGEADSVSAAKAAAGSLRPDAVLVDVGLPDGNGITLAGYLTALPWRPRVVLTSSNSEAASAADVQRSGAQAFVPKDQLPNAELHRLLGG
jgi:CheY-like chemotaxis protein